MRLPGAGVLWLPAGLVAFAVLRFRPDPATWESMLLMWARSLTPVAPCGLPLALCCRRTAWAVAISLPARIAGWWLARRA